MKKFIAIILFTLTLPYSLSAADYKSYWTIGSEHVDMVGSSGLLVIWEPDPATSTTVPQNYIIYGKGTSKLFPIVGDTDEEKKNYLDTMHNKLMHEIGYLSIPVDAISSTPDYVYTAYLNPCIRLNLKPVDLHYMDSDKNSKTKYSIDFGHRFKLDFTDVVYRDTTVTSYMSWYKLAMQVCHKLRKWGVVHHVEWPDQP